MYKEDGIKTLKLTKLECTNLKKFKHVFEDELTGSKSDGTVPILAPPTVEAGMNSENKCGLVEFCKMVRLLGRQRSTKKRICSL